MSVWRSGNAAKGVCVKVNGEMIEYILNRCNNGYQTHAHVTMYTSLANFSNIECLFRVEKYVILKPFLTNTFLSFKLSTSIWTSSKISYFSLSLSLSLYIYIYIYRPGTPHVWSICIILYKTLFKRKYKHFVNIFKSIHNKK